MYSRESISRHIPGASKGGLLAVKAGCWAGTRAGLALHGLNRAVWWCSVERFCAPPGQLRVQGAGQPCGADGGRVPFERSSPRHRCPRASERVLMPPERLQLR